MIQEEEKRFDITKARGATGGQILKYILDKDLTIEEAIEKGLKETLEMNEDE